MIKGIQNSEYKMIISMSHKESFWDVYSILSFDPRYVSMFTLDKFTELYIHNLWNFRIYFIL